MKINSMDLHLLPTLAFFFFMMVAACQCHAVTPEAYWKTVLGDTPMPNAVKELLHGNKGKAMYINKKSPDQVKLVYQSFEEKDLRPGLNFNVEFAKIFTGSPFLPRPVADSLPFASNKLDQILKYFSIKPESPDARTIKYTLEVCETEKLREEKYCATSLESMVDYATSMLGKDVTVMSTEAPKAGTTMSYTVVDVRKLGTHDSAISCHKTSYPYAVYYCHKPIATTPYVLTLVGADGLKFQAPIICHSNKTFWSLVWLPFEIPEVKSVACHFLDSDVIVWIRN